MAQPGDPFGGVFAGRRVLLTGHSGFKGGWLTLWLDSRSPKRRHSRGRCRLPSITSKSKNNGGKVWGTSPPKPGLRRQT